MLPAWEPIRSPEIWAAPNPASAVSAQPSVNNFKESCQSFWGVDITKVDSPRGMAAQALRMATPSHAACWEGESPSKIKAAVSLGNDAKRRGSSLHELRHLCDSQCETFASAQAFQGESIRRTQDSMGLRLPRSSSIRRGIQRNFGRHRFGFGRNTIVCDKGPHSSNHHRLHFARSGPAGRCASGHT